VAPAASVAAPAGSVAPVAAAVAGASVEEVPVAEQVALPAADDGFGLR
jgi:hypothetical protein